MNDEIQERILDLPLSKSGNSIAVVVPKKVLVALGLGHGDFVRVIVKKTRVME